MTEMEFSEAPMTSGALVPVGTFEALRYQSLWREGRGSISVATFILGNRNTIHPFDDTNREVAFS